MSKGGQQNTIFTVFETCLCQIRQCCFPPRCESRSIISSNQQNTIAKHIYQRM